MKKLLLLISVMLVMTGMMAQDVYSAGYYTTSGGTDCSAVYKNGERLYYSSGNISTAVVVDPSTNDVYWVDNKTDNGVYNYGDIFKNGTRLLSNPVGSGTYINDLFWYANNSNPLRAAGCIKGTNTNKSYACIWRGNGDSFDSDPQYKPNYDDGFASNAIGLVVVRDQDNGVIRTYYCGSRQNTEAGGTPRATVWKDGNVLWTLSDVNSYAYSIDYYDGRLYTIVQEVTGGSNYVLKVFRDNSLLYTLADSGNCRGNKIKVVNGDVWVSGFAPARNLFIWKNGVRVYDLGSGGSATSIDINSEGIYTSVRRNSQGYIYKNTEILYTINNCNNLEDICVVPLQCENEDVRTLPYFEGFEMGETDWECWTKVDSDGQNGITNPSSDVNGQAASYWQRMGEYNVTNMAAPTGDYYAAHRYNPNHAQEGWLISPKLFLQPGRDNSTLTFKSCEYYPSYYNYSGVWISTTNTNTSSFTEVWNQTNASNNWKTVSIDLSAYQGQAIYIAFKYAGENAHDWYIDDVSVTESWVPCDNAVTSYPFINNFDSNPFVNTCWYLLDNDHSGGLRCWQYDESNHCVKHPDAPTSYGNQEGWMITKKLQLDAGQNYTLSFKTKYDYPGLANNNSSIWIALDKTGVPDISDYTQIWVETDAISNWIEKSIDLTSYAGHTVNIAFKYEGTNAHIWYLDDITVTAALPQYQINVVANNPAWGTVTGGNTYDQGATATITATPNSGYDFLKWTKDGVEVTNNASYSFTVTESATYTAVFGEQAVTYYTIITAVTPEGAGIVTGGNTYEAGATATLAASANPGWQFVQWNDGNTDNPRTITVNGDATYTAQFSQINYTINVSASPDAGGTVTGSGTNYHYGQTVELTATANPGFDFLNWNDGVATQTRIITVTENADYVAYFAEQGTTVYTITVIPNDITLGTVEGGGVFPEGTVITISATPIGYATFVNWSDGSTKAIRQVTVTGDAIYTANFEMGALYTIVVESANPEMGSASGGGEFPEGAEIVIQATAFGGYHFNGWDDDNYENPRVITVTGNATYRARFSQQQQETYHITVMCNANEGTVIGEGNYLAGTTVTIAAIPLQGYRFKQWQDGNTENPRLITVTGDAIYFATFEGDGIDENDANSISLYPNPANDVIRIEGLGMNAEVRIYNVLGELVKVVNVNDNEEINVSNLSAGLYIVRSGNAMLKFTKE